MADGANLADCIGYCIMVPRLPCGLRGCAFGPKCELARILRDYPGINVDARRPWAHQHRCRALRRRRAQRRAGYDRCADGLNMLSFPVVVTSPSKGRESGDLIGDPLGARTVSRSAAYSTEKNSGSMGN